MPFQTEDLMNNKNKFAPFEEFAKGDRGITVGLFVIVVSCIVILIHVIPMPNRASVSKTLETMVLESIAMAVDTPENTEIDEVAEEETSVEDIDELLSSFLIESPAELLTSKTELSVTESNRSELQRKVDFDFGTVDETGFGSSLVEDLPQVERRQGRSLRPTIESKFVSESDVSLGTDVEIAEDLSSEREILESVYEGLDRSALTAEEIAHEDNVVLWLTDHKVLALDRIVNSWLGVEKTDLIFKDQIQLADDFYTVILAYSPVNRILKIVLIKDDEIFYFIDPGLQNRANYFEKGRVIYERDEVIMIESEEHSVQNPEAVRLFNLFSQWFKNNIK